jgi:uncharacterized surface protein with fasciclin (FAS1) repeats
MTARFELAGLGGFVAVLASTGQLDPLCGAAPFTILAPSDEALAELPPALLAQPQLLARLLAFHIVPGERVDREGLAQEPSLTTATGQRVYAELEDEDLFVDGARLVRADIRVGAGIVHQVDQVLVPAELDLAELLHLSDGFPRLLAAIEVLELEHLLRGEVAHTLLAPRGLERLPTWEWHRLLRGEGRAELEVLVRRHLVAGHVYLDSGARLVNLEGERLELGGSRARPNIAGRAVAVRDIEARNGLVHVIDGLLGP